MLMLSLIAMQGGACASTSASGTVASQARASDSGRPVAGDWRRIEALPIGTSIVVTQKTGSRIVGTLADFDEHALSIVVNEGSELTLPKSDVQQIVSPAMEDGLINGAAIGGGIGIATAVTILAVAGSGGAYVLPSAKWGAPLLLTAAGALLGMVVDRAHKGERVVYRAP